MRVVTTRSGSALSIVVTLVLLVVSTGAASAAVGELRAVGTFSSADDVVSPPHEDHLLFVVERPDRVRVVSDGVVVTQSFLDVSGLVTTACEGGLLSIA